MLIDSASSATLDQDMFWHGVSLVSSRLKGASYSQWSFSGRETLVNLSVFWVTTDITGAWTAAFIGNQMRVFAFDQAVDSLRVKPRGL